MLKSWAAAALPLDDLPPELIETARFRDGADMADIVNLISFSILDNSNVIWTRDVPPLAGDETLSLGATGRKLYVGTVEHYSECSAARVQTMNLWRMLINQSLGRWCYVYLVATANRVVAGR